METELVNRDLSNDNDLLQNVNGSGNGNGNGEKCMEDHIGTSFMDGENIVCIQSPSSECSGKSFVMKVPRANSKLILQNMEEVLNSVKKKHRQKHRRKKEQKKLAMLAVAEAEAAAAEKLSSQTIAITIDVCNSKTCESSRSSSSSGSSSSTNGGSKKKSVKKPLQEQQAIQDQDQSQSQATNHMGKCKKQQQQQQQQHNHSKQRKSMTKMSPKTMENGDIKKSKQTTNAFEVMMNARNKSIGSNTPGKEPNLTTTMTDYDVSPAKNSTINAKRKNLLQKWADRKGGNKRKMDEEMREAYVEDRLEKRAKRLKKMLTGNGDVNASSNSYDKPRQQRVKTSRRSQRLSSSDCEELEVKEPQTLDSETVEFLSKLSSPTKKRDSLLGYFKKIPSPNEGNSLASSTPHSSTTSKEKHERKAIINETETPKRKRGRPKKIKTNAIDTPACEESIAQTTQCETPSLLSISSDRPKRACAERKAKYGYDLDDENSPIKKDAMPIPIIDTDVIELDSSSSFNVLNGTKSPKKLAPLFMRSMPVPKPSPDPEALKARQEFLRSGVPDKLKLEQEKQKHYDQTYDDMLELYPKISHLPQWTEEEVRFLSKTSASLCLRQNDNKDETLSSKSRKGKATKARNSLIGITQCTTRDFRADRKSIKTDSSSASASASTQQLLHLLSANLAIVNNKRQIIKKWKTEFDRFPTYKCYNQLRTKYRFFSALDYAQNTEQVTESFVVTRSTRRTLESSMLSSSSSSTLSNTYQEDDVKPPATAPNGELLFTEKYKPMLYDQVLVNLNPVTQLRDFLASWANGNGTAKNSQNLDDSMDNFLNDSNSNQSGATCNSVVLLGPASSGKTNAVFALANEMNFNVLEINAGMKRTGKKLIQELLEATQSHQIRNESTGGTAVKSKAQKNLLKMSLNSLKGRKQSINGSNSSISMVSDIELISDSSPDLNARKCLILIEDADIIFEQTDAGFTDAVYTLAASSKRPVIVIATNPNCQHLQRLMGQNTIKFTAPNALSISKYLAVVSLMENCPVSLDDLISLYLYNQQDLRKTLHELQFFIQSGGDYHKNKQLSSNSSTIQKQQKTPQKKSEQNGQHFFASPGKRRLSSEDTNLLSNTVNDEQLKRETQQQQQQQQHKTTEDELYVHRSLFEFYTLDQNFQWRIPFPVNFDLFYINLNDIFAMAKKLKPHEHKSPATHANISSKRRTRSPKKVWLSTATATATATITATSPKNISEAHKNTDICESLNALSNFYNNISIATLVVARDESIASAAKESRSIRDRLMPYLSESIAHDIIENAININLEAESCPYNLFESEKKSIKLCDLMGPTMAMLPNRMRVTDFEPALRAICRSEQHRAAQERRSTRFYHYLRNSCADICNFSQQPFEKVCNVFQEKNKYEEEKVELEKQQQQQKRQTCDENKME